MKNSERISPENKLTKRRDIKTAPASKVIDQMKLNKKLNKKLKKKYPCRNNDPDMFTINGRHRILCPPSPGTEIVENIVKEKAIVLSTKVFYEKKAKSSASNRNLHFFPHLA